MLSEERIQRIVEFLVLNRTASVYSLQKQLGVSGSTIRKDLTFLEKKGLLRRVHGGAILIEFQEPSIPLFVDPSYKERYDCNLHEKTKIGETAAEFVENGETIMIDGGTTTLQVARELSRKKRELTVVTNGINICTELIKSNNLEVVLSGGYLRRKNLSMIGEMAGSTIGKYTASKAVLGINGISTSRGLTTPHLFEAEIKKSMIKNSKQLIIVADATKIGKVSLMAVAPLSAVHFLVTDNRVTDEQILELKRAGIREVIKA